MNESPASKWNVRYNATGSSVPAPARVLSQGVRWLPESRIIAADAQITKRTALDLASGLAGNAHFLASKGFIVSAWDVSEVAIEKVRNRKPSVISEMLVRDVSAQPPEERSFDVIVVSRFLDRSLCPAIARALKPNGVLFYQTFVSGLNNPDYQLKPNELLSLFDTLHVLEYHEGDVGKAADAVVDTGASADSGATTGTQCRVEARLIARRVL